ncbi:ABC transporter permease [Flavilitoribacter nigricans]|uniref:FtsX-like permease family protein n=1 Tax=Flavilitoribacter nigricans (strain ATCC 23147 / DSM 23189 / NBRC 102662 / NCIMB 1420 / SS-2) TaxID=1122177 RepID=A0A2D0N0E8_FLAN2|nr:ABC transporter permease [Flavilitoribacter nigricans]PHN01937.1 hypothetical protein CRP01_34665 [Flavilitoribacter nigricans DSM 23189 = NBRC 102662]
MLFNHFKIAWRKIIRQKGFTALNLMGLAVGLAAAFLTVAYVHHQYSFDRFHEYSDRLYLSSAKSYYGETSFNTTRFDAGFGPIIEEQVPGVEAFVRTAPQQNVVLSTLDGTEKYNEGHFLFADSNFLNIFSFELLAGNRNTALEEPFSVLLTPAMAEKYFGTADPIGQTINFLPPSGGYLSDTEVKDHALTVSGVIAPAPGNSNLQYDFIASFNSLRTITPLAFESPAARLGSFNTYFLLADGQNAAPVQSRIEEIITAAKPEQDRENRTEISISTLPDYYFTDALQKKMGLFIGIALLILLLAIVNYASLTTARATQRAKEVGVRKTLGARRGQLISQFFGESSLMVCLAFGIALFLSRLALPAVNYIADTRIELDLLLQGPMVLAITGILILSIFLAGSYPALALSRFIPAKVLRTGRGSALKGERTRQALMVFQFVISAGLIVCSLVMQSQMNFLGERDLGFDRDQLLVIPFEAEREGTANALKAAAGRESGVIGASISTAVPFKSEGTNFFFAKTPTGKPLSIHFTSADRDFLELIGAKWIAQDDSRNDGSNTAKRVFLNETALEKMELKNPTGERILKEMSGDENGYTVNGVIENYAFFSYKTEVDPQVIFELTEEDTRQLITSAYLTLRLKPQNDIQATMSRLETAYKGMDFAKPFDFFFIDDQYQDLYRSEMRTAALFKSFTFLAIFIACLGLLGLSAFLAERRTKEIGIRKVFGATVANIVGLLSRDFLYLVAIALVIALPLTWYFMGQWLEDFAFRIELSWWLFVVAAAMALGIAFLTVSFQSIKAALANPVKSLRNE